MLENEKALIIVPPLGPEPTPDGILLKGAKLSTLFSGLIIMLLGGLMALFFAISLAFSPALLTANESTIILGLLVLGVGLGGGLSWHSGRAFIKKTSRAFKLPPVWLLLVIYVPTLIIGQAIIMLDIWPVIFFPAPHIMGAVLPSLMILAFASRVLHKQNLCWRDIILNLGGGTFLAPLIAIICEIILGILMFILTIGLLYLIPGGDIRVLTWLEQVQDPFFMNNPANVYELMLFPPIPITLIFIFVVVAPLVEELAKPVGVYLLSYKRPTMAQAWVWGLAGGAGFALFENIFNTLISMEAWAIIMLVRIGATAMHCLGSGLIGWGWQSLLTTPSPLAVNRGL